jgi:hypothetical protein
MGEKPGFAERFGMFLTGPMQVKPGDSTLKKVARFGYMVASPIVVGPAVLAGHAMDEIHDLGHIREISQGLGQLERTRVRVNPIWRPGNRTQSAPALLPKPASTSKPTPPRFSAPKLPEVPRLKLHMPAFGQSLQHRPPILKAPTLHLKPATTALRSTMNLLHHSTPSASHLRLSPPVMRLPLSRPFQPTNAFRPSLPFRR